MRETRVRTLSEDRLEYAGDHKQADDENHQDDSANYFEHARAPPGMNVWALRMFSLARRSKPSCAGNVCSSWKADTRLIAAGRSRHARMTPPSFRRFHPQSRSSD